MKRKKGFTVVELVICFVLISIIVIGMLTIALNYRKNARESAIRVTLEEYKVNLTRKIQNDITNLGVNYVKYCDTAVTDCVEILFNDGTSKKIEIESLNPTDRYIKYGGEKFVIEDNLEGIENPTLKDVSTLLPLEGTSLSLAFQNNSSVYKIDIPITHRDIEGDYGIHITAFGTGNDPGVYVSTVTFDPTGGSEPNPKTKTVTFKQAYGELPTTTKNGYNFIGWYPTKTSNTKVESITLVNKIRNHTLYARWSPKSYVVTFDPNGGNTPNPQQKTVTYTKKYGNLAEVSRTGHSFDGWYTASSGGTEITSDNVVNEHKNHTLFAHWAANDYTVTFNANGGGTPSKSTMEVTYGEQYGELATISRTGYTFAGWYTQASGGTKITSTSTYLIDGNQTLYAHWTANSYTIAYTLNGGSKGTSAPTSGTYGSNVTISNPSKTVKVTGNANGSGATVGSATSKAQIFAGWTSTTINTSTARYGTNDTAWTNGNSKVTATKFKNLIPSGTVTLVANWTPVAFNLPTATKTGNTCKWYGNTSGTGTSYKSEGSYTPSATSSATINLYAKCSPNKYTVTFNANGGGTPSKATMEVTYGNQYGTLATISRTGYTFNGWYTQASGGTKITSTSTYSIAGNQNLYAHWKANSFTTAAFNIHGYGNELHGQPEDFPNAIDEESERRVVTTLDLSSYTKMTLNIGRFNSDEAVLEHNDGDGSYARIYIGSTRVINANTKVNKDNWAPYSVTVDISKYNGTYTIYKAYYDMNGYSQASNCTLTFE